MATLVKQPTLSITQLRLDDNAAAVAGGRHKTKRQVGGANQSVQFDCLRHEQRI